ncbi:MAG: 23S rRNA (pseudouridine(1915)-N(3))-methyltransferase RlmH [Myxococcota bacterium]
MKLRIVAVGSIKERHFREGIDVYLGRLRRYCNVEEVEVKGGKEVGPALRRACRGATVVALDVAGDTMSSREMARRLERLAARDKGIVAFMIGGADGLPSALCDEAHARWSLSALTFPHRLARLLLSEQLYRALTIIRGAPYDH